MFFPRTVSSVLWSYHALCKKPYPFLDTPGGVVMLSAYVLLNRVSVMNAEVSMRRLCLPYDFQACVQIESALVERV